MTRQNSGVGMRLPILHGESLGGYIGRALGVSHRVADTTSEAAHSAMMHPLLPKNLEELCEQWGGVLADAKDIALAHTAYRYYAAFAPVGLAMLLWCSVLTNRNPAWTWKLPGTGPWRSLNARLPAVCRQCLREWERKKRPLHWVLLFALPGGEFCTRHKVPVSRACDRCQKLTPQTRKRKWFGDLPGEACHCGLARQEIDWGDLGELALGIAEDIQAILEGGLDCYPSAEILAAMSARAEHLGLQDWHDGDQRTRDLVHATGASRYLFAANATGMENNRLVAALRGHELAGTPLVNVVAIRLLFGSLKDAVAHMERARKARGWKSGDDMPVHERRLAVDEDYIAPLLALVGGMRERGILSSRRSNLINDIGAFVTHVVAFAEEELSKALADPMQRSYRVEKRSKCPRRTEVLRIGGLTDADVSQRVEQRAQSLQRAPFHPPRYVALLLQGVMHPTTYYTHRAQLPETTAALHRHLESREAYARRLYQAVATHQPERLRHGMPRTKRLIDEMSNAEIAAMLRELGIKDRKSETRP